MKVTIKNIIQLPILIGSFLILSDIYINCIHLSNANLNTEYNNDYPKYSEHSGENSVHLFHKEIRNKDFHISYKIHYHIFFNHLYSSIYICNIWHPPKI